MKTWKKFAYSCVTLASAAALAACGSLTGNKTASSSATTEDGLTNILMYQIGDAPKNIDVLLENANKIIEKEAGAHLDIKYISWGDYKDKMAIITSSGEEYDIAFADNYIINAQKGAYADLTELYKKEGKALYDIIDPAYIKGNTIDGKIYAVPVIGNVASQQMLSFNQDMVDKYGFDISKVDSYDDVESMLATIKEKEADVTPFAWVKSSKPSTDGLEYPAGNELPFAIDLKGDTTKVVNPFEVDRHMVNLRTIHKYYKAGYIMADAATTDATFSLDVANWFVREETQGPADFGDSLLSTVAGYKITSKPITSAYKTSGSTQVANFVISKTSKNKEKAMEVLTLINTNPELLNGLVFGPEGVNWEKDPSAENRIKLLDGYKGDTRMSAWNTGNSQILYITDKVTDEDVKKAEELLAGAEESPLLGFNFNADAVKTEITSIQNIMSQYAASINTGTVDPDVAVPEMLKKLEAEESYKKVKEEMQKQYDEFLANK
ncbi:TPA: ABC transporter substrate-binding protein [Streptococcus suis]